LGTKTKDSRCVRFLGGGGRNKTRTELKNGTKNTEKNKWESGEPIKQKLFCKSKIKR